MPAKTLGSGNCLLIGNSRTEEMVGDLAELSPAARRAGGCSAQRTIWFARSGDILVLPYSPPKDYLRYVTGLLGIDPATLTVLVPPPGALGTDLITPDRTAAAGFRAALAAAVRQQRVTDVLAIYTDLATVQLAEAVGLQVPGHRFSAQAGDALVNSKAGFRALAGGTGAPIAPGLVTGRRCEAEHLIGELLGSGRSVMLKREFTGGGQGNDLLTTAAGVRVAGTERAYVLPDRTAVADYLDSRWTWLTAGGRHQVVVEEYLADCDTVYAEYLIDDDGPVLTGIGELLMDPVAVGQITPAPALDDAGKEALLAAGASLVQALHTIGYRGFVSTDSLLTPDGDIVITETNGRISGSTHLHMSIEARLLPEPHRGRRVLAEYFDLPVPSFGEAVSRLAAAGLAFDPTSGTGALVTSCLLPDHTVSYCLVTRDWAAAEELRAAVLEVFAADRTLAGRPQ